MMKTQGLEGFVLSGKFVVCLLLAQFLLMPVATEDFHWAAIGGYYRLYFVSCLFSTDVCLWLGVSVVGFGCLVGVGFET